MYKFDPYDVLLAIAINIPDFWHKIKMCKYYLNVLFLNDIFNILRVNIMP